MNERQQPKPGTRSEDFVVPTNEAYDPKKGVPTANNEIRGNFVDDKAEKESDEEQSGELGNPVTGNRKREQN